MPSKGDVISFGINTKDEAVNTDKIRQNVGLVFQYPEYQLFEETVGKDIAFGPKNLKLSEEEVEKRVRESMEIVGLSYEEFKDKSPFNLSGGQKRRVAIAGILAMKPKVLVFDEPTAGLDPRSRKNVLNFIQDLVYNKNITVVMVSHSMDDMVEIADRIIVMDDAQVVMDGAPKEVFKESKKLSSIGLSIPQTSEVLNALYDKGYKDIDLSKIKFDETIEEIEGIIGGKKDA